MIFSQTGSPNGVFSRLAALSVVTTETVRQTNHPSVASESTLISLLDHADKASARSPIG